MYLQNRIVQYLHTAPFFGDQDLLAIYFSAGSNLPPNWLARKIPCKWCFFFRKIAGKSTIHGGVCSWECGARALPLTFAATLRAPSTAGFGLLAAAAEGHEAGEVECSQQVILRSTLVSRIFKTSFPYGGFLK